MFLNLLGMNKLCFVLLTTQVANDVTNNLWTLTNNSIELFKIVFFFFVIKNFELLHQKTKKNVYFILFLIYREYMSYIVCIIYIPSPLPRKTTTRKTVSHLTRWNGHRNGLWTAEGYNLSAATIGIIFNRCFQNTVY